MSRASRGNCLAGRIKRPAHGVENVSQDVNTVSKVVQNALQDEKNVLQVVEDVLLDGNNVSQVVVNV
jgi:hypothetical protein